MTERVFADIRPARPGDEDFLERILNVAFGHDNDPLFGVYKEALNRQGPTVIAELDGQPVGAAWCRYDSGGYGDVEGAAEVTIGIEREDLRGMNIGAALMHGLIEASRDAEIETLSLEVSTDNEAAMRVYKNAGFIVLNEIEDPGENKRYATMTLSLI